MTALALDLDFPAPDEAPAIACDGERLSYGALRRRAGAIAHRLAAAGLEPGRRFAYMLVNGPNCIAAYMACAATGIVGVPLSLRLTPAEVAFQLADSGAEAVLFSRDFAPVMAQLAPTLPAVAAWIAEDELPADGVPLPPPAARPELAPTDPFCIMYTGGTTGSPKAAVQTRGGWACCLRATVDAWGATAADRHLISLPMSHAAWFSAGATLCAGGQVTVLRAWDPVRALQAIEQDAITTLNMIPTMLGDLVKAHADNPVRVDSVRLLTVAGSLLPAATLTRAREIFGPVVGNIYGLTEAAGPVTFLMPADLDGPRGDSVGRANPFIELAILDEDGQPTDGSSPGEIGLRGPQVTPGYWGRPSETAEAYCGRWFRTGDVARLDGDGFVYLVDRKKDMIKSGGYNVYPSEIEQVVYGLPAVLECIVLGLPDERWIEAVHAVVVPRPGRSLDAGEVLAACRGRLAAHKVPKAVHVVDRIPRTRFGKFDKAATRLLLAQA